MLVGSAFGAFWEGFIKFVVKRASKQDQTLHMEGKLRVILYFREEWAINPTPSVHHLSLIISSFQVCFWMTSSVNQNALNWPGNLANVGKIMHKVVFVFLRIENAFYSFDRFLKCLYIKCRKIKFVHFIVCYFLWEIAIFSL